MGHSDGKGSCPWAWTGKQKEEETQNKESEMGNASATAVKVAEPPAPASSEKKLKPCCACPETKKVRDACIIENGEENCGPLIEEHKACMRKMGFKV